MASVRIVSQTDDGRVKSDGSSEYYVRTTFMVVNNDGREHGPYVHRTPAVGYTKSARDLALQQRANELEY